MPKLADIKKKILAGETLTPEELKALEAVDLDAMISKNDAEKEADRKAAAARKEADEKVTAAQAKIEEATARIKELEDAQGTKSEQGERQVAALTKELGGLKKQLDTEKATATAADRKSKIRALANSMKWNRDVVDSKIQEFVLNEALAEIETNDLEAEAVTKPILEGLRTNRQGLFMTDVAGGTGEHHEAAPGATAMSTDDEALLHQALHAPVAEAEKAVTGAMQQHAKEQPAA